MRAAVIALGLAALSGGPAAAEDLLRLDSPVYEAAGSASELARKAAPCIGRIVKPGWTTAPTIVAQDIDGGTIVANAAFEFAKRFAFAVDVERGRAKLTFQAKEGRFRIEFTEIQWLIGRDWYPADKPKKRLNGDIEAVLLNISEQVSACVKAPTGEW